MPGVLVLAHNTTSALSLAAKLRRRGVSVYPTTEIPRQGARFASVVIDRGELGWKEARVLNRAVSYQHGYLLLDRQVTAREVAAARALRLLVSPRAATERVIEGCQICIEPACAREIDALGLDLVAAGRRLGGTLDLVKAAVARVVMERVSSVKRTAELLAVPRARVNRLLSHASSCAPISNDVLELASRIARFTGGLDHNVTCIVQSAIHQHRA